MIGARDLGIRSVLTIPYITINTSELITMMYSYSSYLNTSPYIGYVKIRHISSKHIRQYIVRQCAFTNRTIYQQENSSTKLHRWKFSKIVFCQQYFSPIINFLNSKFRQYNFIHSSKNHWFTR